MEGSPTLSPDQNADGFTANRGVALRQLKSFLLYGYVLLLFAVAFASIFAWISSYRTAEHIVVRIDSAHFRYLHTLISQHGQVIYQNTSIPAVAFSVVPAPATFALEGYWQRHRTGLYIYPLPKGIAGFSLGYGHISLVYRASTSPMWVAIPYWAITLIPFVLLMVYRTLARRRSRQSSRPGFAV